MQDNKEKKIESASEILKKYAAQPTFNKGDFGDGIRWTRVPSDLRNYLFLSDYGVKEATLILYMILVEYFNEEDGCAYPTQSQLALQMNKKPNAIKGYIKTLKDVGLIKVLSRGKGFSNRYLPLQPLEKSVLLSRFTLANDRYMKLCAELKDHDMRDMERMPDHMKAKRRRRNVALIETYEEREI
ncbi:TPA: helix-turn-helix domain-containing protein, partial [Bacillus cereus]|nr:helix-turn-helix domain-containing protein [Bacillus cereus]